MYNIYIFIYVLINNYLLVRIQNNCKETIQGTLMVVAMAIIASLFFLLLDQVLKFFLELILKVSI